jgi:hypothetical protein
MSLVGWLKLVTVTNTYDYSPKCLLIDRDALLGNNEPVAIIMLSWFVKVVRWSKKLEEIIAVTHGRCQRIFLFFS